MKLIPTLNIKFYSSYYISVLLCYFFLRLPVFKDLLSSMSSWLLAILSSGGFKVIGNGPIWSVFFASTVILTMLVKIFVTDALGWYISKDIGFNSNFEKTILFVLIFGSQVYLLNEIFRQPMPSEWLHPWIVKGLGGELNTYKVVGNSYGLSDNAWSIMQYIWYLGPTLYLYFFNNRGSKAPAADPHAH